MQRSQAQGSIGLSSFACRPRNKKTWAEDHQPHMLNEAKLFLKLTKTGFTFLRGPNNEDDDIVGGRY